MVFVSVVSLFVAYYGIPAGSVVEDVTVVSESVVPPLLPRRVRVTIKARYYDIKLSSGEIIRVSTDRDIIRDGKVVLDRRYSLISRQYIYSLAE
jgi:hypothetical protein